MNDTPDQTVTPFQRAAYTVATFWIFGVALFYYTRISFQIYATHQSDIDNLLKRLTDALGIMGG